MRKGNRYAPPAQAQKPAPPPKVVEKIVSTRSLRDETEATAALLEGVTAIAEQHAAAVARAVAAGKTPPQFNAAESNLVRALLRAFV